MRSAESVRVAVTVTVWRNGKHADSAGLWSLRSSARNQLSEASFTSNGSSAGITPWMGVPFPSAFCMGLEASATTSRPATLCTPDASRLAHG